MVVSWKNKLWWTAALVAMLASMLASVKKGLTLFDHLV